MLPIFGVDPLFFGILVPLNLQTSFLTPPMAMAAYYLKGVAPPQVQLMEIFKGVMPFLSMVFLAMVILYMFPQLALWLPTGFLWALRQRLGDLRQTKSAVGPGRATQRALGLRGGPLHCGRGTYVRSTGRELPCAHCRARGDGSGLGVP